jgi:hypothetical protein
MWGKIYIRFYPGADWSTVMVPHQNLEINAKLTLEQVDLR